jgi:hypothetical protein
MYPSTPAFGHDSGNGGGASFDRSFTISRRRRRQTNLKPLPEFGVVAVAQSALWHTVVNWLVG